MPSGKRGTNATDLVCSFFYSFRYFLISRPSLLERGITMEFFLWTMDWEHGEGRLGHDSGDNPKPMLEQTKRRGACQFRAHCREPLPVPALCMDVSSRQDRWLLGSGAGCFPAGHVLRRLFSNVPNTRLSLPGPSSPSLLFESSPCSFGPLRNYPSAPACCTPRKLLSLASSPPKPTLRTEFDFEFPACATCSLHPLRKPTQSFFCTAVAGRRQGFFSSHKTQQRHISTSFLAFYRSFRLGRTALRFYPSNPLDEKASI